MDEEPASAVCSTAVNEMKRIMLLSYLEDTKALLLCKIEKNIGTQLWSVFSRQCEGKTMCLRNYNVDGLHACHEYSGRTNILETTKHS